MSLRRICKHATGASDGAADNALSNAEQKAFRSSICGGVIRYIWHVSLGWELTAIWPRWAHRYQG